MNTEWQIEKITHPTEQIFEEGNSAPLQLSSITLNADYCKEWHETKRDFVVLTRNGEMLNKSLYRVGGLGTPNLAKDRYFLLLKYVEAYYDKKILEMSGNNDPKHLEGRWTIVDRNGVEKVELPAFSHAYLVKNSCIYFTDSKYYNIETGEFYCQSNTSMICDEFVFLENRFDDDRSRRGVMKINKQDGTWVLFPSTQGF